MTKESIVVKTIESIDTICSAHAVGVPWRGERAMTERKLRVSGSNRPGEHKLAEVAHGTA